MLISNFIFFTIFLHQASTLSDFKTFNSACKSSYLVACMLITVTNSYVVYIIFFYFSGTSCLDIREKGLRRGDGRYLIDPDEEGEGSPFEVCFDMTSFGGGWTMCYTTDSHVGNNSVF